MPASGIFISAIAQIKAAVTALGYKPVTTRATPAR